MVDAPQARIAETNVQDFNALSLYNGGTNALLTISPYINLVRFILIKVMLHINICIEILYNCCY